MIGERSTDAPKKDRRRRALPFFLLLLLPFALGGISGGIFVELLNGAPKASSQSTSPGNSPGTSPAPSAAPAESVAGVQIVVAATPIPSGSGGGSDTAQVSGADFKITGGVQNLTLGVTTPIRLTLTNPNGVPIYVTALTATISADSTPPGCSSATNLQIAQSNASSADPITVAAGGSVTLTSAPRAPQITLLNLPSVNQDVCKSKSFALTYSGSAHS